MKEKVNNQAAGNFTLKDYCTATALELTTLIRQGVTTPEQLIDFAAEVIEMTADNLKNVVTLRIEEAKLEAAALKDTGQPFMGYLFFLRE